MSKGTYSFLIVYYNFKCQIVESNLAQPII